MQKIWQILILCFTSFANIVSANPLLQSHDSIHTTVSAYVKAQLPDSKHIESIIRVSPIDPRLTLNRCDQALTSFTTTNTTFNSRFSVGIKCLGSKPWSLYVPVTVEQYTQVVVAAKPVAKGQALDIEDLQIARQNISKLRGGYFSRTQDVVGMIAKRNLRAGKTVSNKQLKPPLLIKRGDRVDIIAKTTGLEIRMVGKALSAGAKGQKIAVSNISSKRKIEAVVVENGLVRIKM